MHSKLKTFNLVAAINCFLKIRLNLSEEYSTFGVGPYEKLEKEGFYLFPILMLSFHSSIHCLALYSRLSTAARGKLGLTYYERLGVQ